MIDLDACDRDFISALAGELPVVPLEHGRERLDGEIGVFAHGGRAIAISAHHCDLTALPDLSGLAHLQRLDVGGNQLAELPPLPPSLRELYIYENRFVRLPALPALRVLDANRNRLVELPHLANYEFVYLASNRLATPPSIANVRYLNVGDNPLLYLPNDRDLEELRAEDAGLSSLTDAIANLTAVRELHLRNNHLAELPAAIGSLAQLRVLDLRGNRLDTLPDSLATLPLAKLDLRWNPLRNPPAWLHELRDCLVYT